MSAGGYFALFDDDGGNALLLSDIRRSHQLDGAADPKAGAIWSLFGIGNDPRLNHEFAVRGGVAADEAAALLTGFFAGRR